METSAKVMEIKRHVKRIREMRHHDPDFRDITRMTFPYDSILAGKGQSNRVYNIKILVVGEVAVGKTCFIRRYYENHFSPNYRSTVGFDCSKKVMKWKQGDLIIKLNIWDVAGNEGLGNMTRIIYRGADAAFVAFDVSRPETLRATTKWKHELDNSITRDDGSHIPCVLLGLKSDLPKIGLAKVSTLMNDFSRCDGYLNFFEASSKKGIGIDDAFNYLVNKVVTKIMDDAQKNETVKLCEEKPPTSQCYC